MEFDSLMILVVGLLAGAAIGYLMAKVLDKRPMDLSPQLKLELEMEKQRSNKLTEDLSELNQQLGTERKTLMAVNSDRAGLKANLRNLQERLQLQKTEVADLQQRFAAEFKNLANEIFEEKSRKFTAQNKVNIGELLDPLKEKIVSFEKKVEDSGKESLRWNSALSEQVKSLKELNRQITKEAENLTKALKGESKSQGTWGEIQLEAILSKVGLEKDVHYFKEKNFKLDDGKNQRPDYVIKLPDEKYLVIDSKVSLTAYTNYFNAADESTQKQCLKAHLESVNTHIKQLGERNYQNIHEISQPDYVMLFMANEPALFIALKEDPDLFEKALNRNIVLVSTTTLMATLRTISYLWKQDLQNKNALEIARQAGALYDKFEGFTNDLQKVGNSLKQTKDQYDAAMNKLSLGTGNLVRRTEKLRELGAKVSKQIDQKLLDRSTD